MEKKKSWFMRHKVLTVILSLIVLIGAGSAIGGSTKKTDSGQANQTSTSSQPAELAKIGDAVRDGKFEFTVKDINCGQATVGSGDFSTDHAQGQYCLLDLTIKNIGSEAQTFDATNQYLYNAKVKYSASDSASLDANPSGSTFLNEINPGNTVSGTVVFDVPQGITPTVAELHDSALSNGIKVSLE